MFKREAPTFKKKGFPSSLVDGKNGFTQVTFVPDFARFGCTELSEDMQTLLKKFTYDAAMIASINKVQVYLNDVLIPINKLTDYVNMYFLKPPKSMISLQTTDSFVVVAPATEWTHVAFTNGVFNRNGGRHVDKWSEALFRPIIDKLGDKNKSLDMREVKKHFFMFVCCFLPNPKFDDQPKHKLVKPDPVDVEVKPTYITKLLKWEFVKKIEEMIQLKDRLTFAKETSSKKGGSSKNNRVEGLSDANFAGKNKKDCVLMICEGLSAATCVVKGMKYGFGNFKGKDTIGVYPIRGKFLNVKNASASTLIKNKELIGICKAVGLVYGTDYLDDKNYEKLRYKKVILTSDADVDGSHITGLIINLFHTLYPTLLQRKGFLGFMRMPIIKIATKPSMNFYFQEQAGKYLSAHQVPSTKIRYLKGLGTMRDDDIKDDFGKRIVQFQSDEQADKMMENVFGGNETLFRKTWIQEYKPRQTYPEIKDGQVEILNITDFLNYEMILYSIDHCRRAIPSILDGLKDSTRKVLYGGFKRGLKYTGESMKVAQFANYVAEKTNYHHGETILYDTITNLAQRFVGSNNIPLFYNDGQFGSRLALGSDAANGRYIFTKLDLCTRFIYREEDDEYLMYRVEDGDTIEPETFYPIVPFILINGGGSIGTGWSSTIPPYDIIQIIAWIKAWLTSSQTPTLIPYYRGFKGSVKVEETKVVTTGLVSKDSKGKYLITEIPIGKRMISISKYLSLLQGMEDAGNIKNIDNQSTENEAAFSFQVNKEGFEVNAETIHLVDSTSTTNMVLFNKDGKLKRYENVNEILTEFCEARFAQYNKRKEGELKKLDFEAKILYNKIRFIEMVINDKIKLLNKDEDVLQAECKGHKFDVGNDGSYDYLFTIQVKQMTSKKLSELQKQYAGLLAASKALKETSIAQLWCRELDELSDAYTKWSKLQK